MCRERAARQPQGISPDYQDAQENGTCTPDQNPRHVHPRRHQQRRVLPPARPARAGANSRPRSRRTAAAGNRQPRPLRQADRRHGRRHVQYQQDRHPVAKHQARTRCRLPVWPGQHRQGLRRLEWQLRQPVRCGRFVCHQQWAGRPGAYSAQRYRHRAYLAGKYRQDHHRPRPDH